MAVFSISAILRFKELLGTSEYVMELSCGPQGLKLSPPELKVSAALPKHFEYLIIVRSDQSVPNAAAQR